MIKKYLIHICLLLSLLCQPILASADELVDMAQKMYPNDNVQAINRPHSSLIIDGNTGNVLWKDNIDEVRDPASMSKLMTLYRLFEDMANGKISKDTVPSSNVSTLMLANLMSNNDPDAFIERMNAKAKELGMTNTVWSNPSGAAISTLQGYYQVNNYPNDAANQTTARDLGILVYHFINQYPDILNYTNQAQVTVKKGTPNEETFDTYNYSLPGAKYALKGVDGLKTGSSPRGAFNYIATIKRGNQRLIAVIMGVGDWADQDGEYYRHPFGNALIEKAYKDFGYKKLLDAGVQKIDGKTYTLEKPFYATVKKGAKEPTLAVKNGYLTVDNDLYTLSEGIRDDMKVEEGAKPELVKETASGKKTTAKHSKWLSLDHFLILIPILILVIILSIEKQSRERRKKEAQKRYNKE